jgi:hypothetical protein
VTAPVVDAAAGPERLLHLAFRVGAVADAVMVVPLLLPSAGAAMLGLDGFAPSREYRYVAGVAAALMAGWTALLLWGDRDPVARRGVLLLTVVPVLAGLFGSGVYAVASGMSALRFVLPMFAFQIAVSLLFVVAYRRAGAAARPADRGGAVRSQTRSR